MLAIGVCCLALVLCVWCCELCAVRRVRCGVWVSVGGVVVWCDSVVLRLLFNGLLLFVLLFALCIVVCGFVELCVVAFWWGVVCFGMV